MSSRPGGCRRCGTGCGTTASEVDADDVAVCFYGDLFRHHPGSDEDRKLEQSRAGMADMLSEMGGDTVAKLSQAAGEATFDRTVDLATAMLAENDLHARLRARIEAEITDDTRVLVAHSLGTVLSYAALASMTTGRSIPSSRSAHHSPCR